MKNNHILGILGGLGPASSAYFYNMLIDHTKAGGDNEHIDCYISNAATTPDRTVYLLDRTKPSPLPRMIEEATKLKSVGCDVLVLICNTAHYFYDEIVASTGVHMINMLDETLKYLHSDGIQRIGLLATDGTVCTKLYQNKAKEYGIECIVPDKEHQKLVMNLIYGYVKKGIPVPPSLIDPLYDHLTERGAQKAILACTDLSILKQQCNLGTFFVDALEILALQTILFCNKTPIGFEELLNGY